MEFSGVKKKTAATKPGKPKPYQIAFGFGPLRRDLEIKSIGTPDPLRYVNIPEICSQYKVWFTKGHNTDYLGPHMKMCRSLVWLRDHGRDLDDAFGLLNETVMYCEDFERKQGKHVVMPGFGLRNDLHVLESWGFNKYPAYYVLKRWTYNLDSVLTDYGFKWRNLRWFLAYTLKTVYIHKTEIKGKEIHCAQEDIKFTEQCYTFGVRENFFLSPTEFHDRKAHLSTLPADLVAFANKNGGFVTPESLDEYRQSKNPGLIDGDFQNSVGVMDSSKIQETIVDVGDEDEDEDEDNFPDLDYNETYPYTKVRTPYYLS